MTERDRLDILMNAYREQRNELEVLRREVEAIKKHFGIRVEHYPAPRAIVVMDRG